jgi:hypothetical protein
MGIVGNLINSALEDSFDKNKTLTTEKSNQDIVQSIMSTKWDFSDDFEVTITNNFINTKFKDKGFADDLKKACKSAIISVDIPPMSSQEIDMVIGGIRRVGVKMYESFRFGIRFRDFEGNKLRKIFTNIFVAQQYMYLDEIATKIEIKQANKVLFSSEKCLITAVQQQTLDNQNTAINEFEVTFISPSITNEHLKDFGLDANYSGSFNK